MYIRKYKGNIPDRIALHADDVNIATYVVYGNPEGIACYDAAGLRPISADKLENLYIKGFLVFDSGTLYTPVSMSKTDSTVTVSILRYNSTTSSIVYSVISSHSEEPEPEPTNPPALATLNIGNKTLNPVFDPEVFEYTLATEDVSDVMVLTTLPDNAEVEVALDDEVITDYGEGILWEIGENVLTITITLGEELPIVYTVTVTASESEPAPPPSLAALNIGNKTLNPVFDPAVFEYTLATEDTSDAMTLTALPEEAEVTVMLNTDVLTNYTEGILWNTTGDNILSITFKDTTPPVVYTITVTASGS